MGPLNNEEPKADFSNVESGSSTTAPEVKPVEEQFTMYTVKGGDSLSAIAKRIYGDAGQWHRIFEANRDKIKNPDLIYPGQELKVPAAEGGAK